MTPHSTPPIPSRPGRRVVAAAAAAVSIGMLALSFAAVPLYRLFCAATGFAGTPQLAKTASPQKGLRTLTVRFDANVAPPLAWKFWPETAQIELRTGETATVYFRASNLSGRETVGRAAFNVSPDNAGAYFDKIACFCFNEQKLAPGQSTELPVVFFLDPALEKDPVMAGVATITLSYTFFAANGSSADANEKAKPL